MTATFWRNESSSYSDFIETQWRHKNGRKFPYAGTHTALPVVHFTTYLADPPTNLQNMASFSLFQILQFDTKFRILNSNKHLKFKCSAFYMFSIAILHWLSYIIS